MRAGAGEAGETTEGAPPFSGVRPKKLPAKSRKLERAAGRASGLARRAKDADPPAAAAARRAGLPPRPRASASALARRSMRSSALTRLCEGDVSAKASSRVAASARTRSTSRAPSGVAEAPARFCARDVLLRDAFEITVVSSRRPASESKPPPSSSSCRSKSSTMDPSASSSRPSGLVSRDVPATSPPASLVPPSSSEAKSPPASRCCASRCPLCSRRRSRIRRASRGCGRVLLVVCAVPTRTGLRGGRSRFAAGSASARGDGEGAESHNGARGRSFGDASVRGELRFARARSACGSVPVGPDRHRGGSLRRSPRGVARVRSDAWPVRLLRGTRARRVCVRRSYN